MIMKNCPKCHAEVSEKAKFCIKCGFNIKKHEEENAQQKYFCPECGTAFIGGSFCPECGPCINDYLSTPLPIEHPGLEIEGTVLVKYTGKSRYLQIPRGITEIYDSAFEKNEVILSVEIPEGVTIIGKKAFAGCRHLQKVTLPSTVEEIYNEAFFGCYELRKIDLPNKIKEIRYKVFASCGIENIEIPEGVTGIGPQAFLNCTDLKTATIPSTVTGVGHEIFANCTGLKNVNLSSKVISKGMFAGSALLSISLPEGVNVIEETSFYNCPHLKTVILPSTIEKINRSAFGYCKALENITLPDNLTTLESGAFHSCTALKTVRIPNAEYDGYNSYTFEDCENIKIIYVPKGKIEIIKDRLFKAYVLLKSEWNPWAPSPDPNITFIEY